METDNLDPVLGPASETDSPCLLVKDATKGIIFSLLNKCSRKIQLLFVLHIEEPKEYVLEYHVLLGAKKIITDLLIFK